MYFTKVPHPANFAYSRAYDAKKGTVRVGDRALNARVRAFVGDVYHLELSAAELWTENLNLAPLNEPEPLSDLGRLHLSRGFEIELLDDEGCPVLHSKAGEAFGLMGQASIFLFEIPQGARFFGMGEKTFGRLELSGIRTKFWNTDVWADFHWKQWEEHTSDPYYLSVPYVVMQVGSIFVGILYENPCAPFIETGAGTTIPTEHAEPKNLVIGALDGLPSLWIIYGPSLAEVTSKMARLVGTTPVPPLWALGYHQSRWGYGGESDLTILDKEFAARGIPCDGLWLDIDYMDGYRVFTFAKKRFPRGAERSALRMAKRSRQVIPILDPGVKQEKGYAVYDDGTRRKVFCQNPQGLPFVGMVWPGRTVFPDFSMPKARDWWAGYVAEFRELGFTGCWVDMNDPATGAVDPQDMLFRDGTIPHLFFHNQYALGMQMASFDGFLKARPDQRPFILSRSGWIGTSRYAAVWTGDNVSNRFYLRSCIPTTLNLALSGIPFNGPDVGGFGGDTTESLMIDWVKCCFLFPFMRNHSVFGCREQEPWRFSKRAERIIGRYIRLRYKLLPYLYNLFIEQEETGHPAIRPILYHYADKKAIHDQFLVGRDLLQAPFLEEAHERRTIVLPGASPWFSLESGDWLKAGTTAAGAELASTPLFVRHGAILPTLPGERTTNEKDLSEVEFHIFLQKGKASVVYRWDDGETYGYRRGERSSVLVEAEARGAAIDVRVRECDDGFGPLRYTVFVYGGFSRATLDGLPVHLTRERVQWTGKPIMVKRLTP